VAWADGRRAPGALAGLALILAAMTLAGPAGAGPLPAPIAGEMRENRLPEADASLYVLKLGEQAPRLSLNPTQPRLPASVIKLLTTAAALDTLGPTFTFNTEAYATGTLTKGRLSGDLVIKGYGDPELSIKDLWGLLDALRRRGVETVAGDIVLDPSYFSPTEEGRGDFDRKPTAAYNALPQGLSVNQQVTEVHMEVAPGQGLYVHTDPPLANVELRNELKLVQAPCLRKHHRPAVTVFQEDGRDVVRLSGPFAALCKEDQSELLVLDPMRHAAGAVEALWRDLGGKLEGRVRVGTLAPGATLLHEVHSRALGELVRDINKPSNNLMTRTLLLVLGAKRLGPPGTPAKGQTALREWLAEAGLDFPELVLDNGSGLSRDAAVSAESLGRLLAYMYRRPTMPEYLASLSVVGVDGTMRKRLRGSPVRGQAHIKTGTVRGASGIAGYVLDRHGDRWVVVALMDGPTLNTWSAHAVQDALLTWVYQGEEGTVAAIKPPTSGEGAGLARRVR
jgi:D-alanyl-D-alanine carboxypeptidase/D-alanyl-D-alanine-endopeptidase (penicillin-binding protein 4)